MMPKKMRFCCQCGDELGEFEDRDYHHSDTCGKPDCDRAARDDEIAERDEAHERLDRDMGW